jgi:pimeloyl-ACP methyl ester carboxylesterase
MIWGTLTALLPLPRPLQLGASRTQQVENGSVDRSTTPYVHESGRPGSPAIVFLQGVGASGRMWEEHMRRLTAYHCLAPDLPGHGRSNRVPWRSLADTSEQVARLIETRFPSRRAHVVGLSLGGAVAHTLLARRPELLDRVVIDGCGALPAWWVGLTKLGVAVVSPFVHRGAVIGVIAQALGIDPADSARFAANMRAASPRAFRRAFAEANSIRLSPEEVAAPNPTLLVAGEREPTIVRASNAAQAALMPHAVARFAPGRAHGWLAVDPELHLRMVQAWIDGQQPPAELVTETTPWSRAKVARLLGRPESELESPARRG